MIGLFDTGVASSNLGDEIIMDAVRKHLRALFPTAFFVHVPTHDIIGEASLNIVRHSDYTFVGGTNLLSSNMDKYNQWKIGKHERKYLRGAVLLGVGWWQYQSAPNNYTAKLLRSVLHPELLHSVRDGYTAQKLAEAGITNVINTSCVTMWDLTPGHCDLIPPAKAEKVVTTLTDYKKDPAADRAFLELLGRSYSKVFLWLQGTGDHAYASSLSLPPNVEFVVPSVDAFDDLLRSPLSLDYVGTRLHAGIRALSHKRRTLILAVDNRALEMGRDFDLPVVDRTDIAGIRRHIGEARKTSLNVPFDKIAEWKRQFVTVDAKGEMAR